MSRGQQDPHPGCWNSHRAAGYDAKDGIMVIDESDLGVVGYQQINWIEDTSSRECRFDGRAQDPRCNGCLK